MSDPVTPLTPEQVAYQEARAGKEGYVHRSLVGLDQFTNVLTGGEPDETISSRAARADEQGKFWGRAMTRFLNFFQSDHGPKAQAGDVERAKVVAGLEDTSGGLK
jgi:hypothetical protein